MTGTGSSRERELAAAQRAVDHIHDRIDALRARAEQRAQAAAADHSGSTFQDRYQRDVTAHHHAVRAARLRFGDVEQVVFGRLDRTDGETIRVGRTAVVDEDGEVALVDWRADAAVPFYRATAAAPAEVARRRRYVARGRTVRDLDDELLDGTAAARLGLTAVSGQGALLEALEGTRTGHMRDIVATIQADQDRIIRSDAGGTLVVSGGPGTGKTVVALHRVAYLLHTHRERLSGRGVLVVGPSRAFSTYVERVLPALGEDRAVLRSLDGFVPSSVEVVGWDRPAVAAVTGSALMAEVCRRAVEASLPALPPTTRVVHDRVAVDVPGHRLDAVRRRLLRRVSVGQEGRRYHDRSDVAEDAMLATLHAAWADEVVATTGNDRPGRGDAEFDDGVAGAATVELLRRCFWPPLSPVRVFGRLVDCEVALADVAGDLLTEEQQALVRTAWSGRTRPTGDDVALLDELDALLGPAPAERRRARHESAEDGGIVLSVDRAAPRPADDPLAPIGGLRYDGYAHVVVDEAQDLSPMQWRMVARRGAFASWTVVGDLAQRARTAEPRSWDEIAALIGRRRVETAELTVNYRTPEEVVEVARAVLVAAGHDPALAPTSVRSSGRRPRLVRAADVERAATAAASDALAATTGTVAVIAPEGRAPSLVAALAAELAGPGGTTPRLSVLDARTAKGLEFDEVVVVAPDEFVAASEVGAHALYVAVTRTTGGLTLVAAPDATVPGAAACDQR